MRSLGYPRCRKNGGRSRAGSSHGEPRTEPRPPRRRSRPDELLRSVEVGVDLPEVEPPVRGPLLLGSDLDTRVLQVLAGAAVADPRVRLDEGGELVGALAQLTVLRVVDVLVVLPLQVGRRHRDES